MFRQLLVSGSVVLLGTMLGKLLSFVRDLKIADLYGASSTTDAFFVAFMIPMLVITLADYLFNVPFVKILAHRFADASDDAWHIAGTIGKITGLGAIVIVGLGLIFSPQFVSLIGPGLDMETAAQAEAMLSIIFPALLLFALTAWLRGVLQANKKFSAQSFTTFAFSTTFLLILWFWGLAEEAMILGWCVLAGAIAQVVILLPAFRATGPRNLFAGMRFKHPGVIEFFVLSSLVVTTGVIGRLGETINRIMASTLPEGSISALYYGLRVAEIPVSLVVATILVVSYPNIVSMLGSRDFKNYRKMIRWVMGVIMITTMASTLIFLFAGEYIIRIAFERGAFSPSDTLMAAESLYFYAPGMIALGGYMLLTQICYATRRGWLILWTSLIGAGVNIIGNILLIGPMVHKGLALATTLSYLTMFLLLSLLLIKYPISEVRQA